MTIAEIKMNIRKIKSLEELKQLNKIIIDCINARRDLEGSEIRTTLMVGDKVKLDPNRCSSRKLRGRIGTITKMNPKTASISFDIGNWKANYGMIILA